MIINNSRLVSATRDELMDIWIFDDDMFRLFDFSKWIIWSKIVGVNVKEVDHAQE